MNQRIDKISEAVKQEVGDIIRTRIKDPRVPELTSVVSVKVSGDLKYAKICISVYGTEEQKQNAIKGLKSAAGFIRSEIGHRLNLRYTPEMLFEIDNSIERGVYISSLIDKTLKSDDDNK